jgi:hypothetical protein
MKKSNKISMPKKDFIKEHKKLVDVLRSPSHKDDLEEAKEQGDELKEVIKDTKLEKMSRPKIRFPNLPKTSTRPDQQIAIVENDKQKKLFARKAAQQFAPDKVKEAEYSYENGNLIRTPEQKISSQKSRDASAKALMSPKLNMMGIIVENKNKQSEPYAGMALAGKAKSKFEKETDPDYQNRKAANLQSEAKQYDERKKKFHTFLEGKDGQKPTYEEVNQWRKENPMPKAVVTKVKSRDTKDLTNEQKNIRNKSTDMIIEHEAAHGLFSDITRHYGPEAAQKVRKHLLSALHPETRAVMHNWLSGNQYKYNPKSAAFPEEIINHSRDILVNPRKREQFRKHVGEEKYNEHIKNLKHGVQEMHNRSKAITPEWLSAEQEVSQPQAKPQKLAASELAKARVDQGKSVDDKRQARNTRAESWERENYGMGSGKSSNPVVSKFLHNAKLHQIKNSPKPKLNKALPLEHYSSQQGLKQIDPRYKKTGVDARVKGRDTEHPHSFYYRAGTAPEDIVQNQAKSKYLVEIPDHAKLYDIGTDPENFSDQVKNENNGAFNMENMHQKIKESGHEGFYNSTHPQLNNVVALYHAHDVKGEGSAK